MPRIPDAATGFPSRQPLRGRGGVPSVTEATGGVMTAASLFRRGAEEQAQGVATMGQELERVGSIMAEIETRRRSRTDAVNRARALEQFEDEATALYREMDATGDWSDEKQLGLYHAKVNERSRELLNSHGGSADSNALLSERMEGLRSSLADLGTKASLEAGQVRAKGILGRNLNKMLGHVYANPLALQSSMVAWEAVVRDLGKPLPEGDEKSQIASGHAMLAESAMNSMLEVSGDIDGVEKILLESPKVQAVLGDVAQARLHTRIAQIRQDRTEALRTGGFSLGPNEIRYDALGKEIARGISRPDKPDKPDKLTPGNVVAPILAKMAAGETLTDAENKALEYYQKMDPLKAFMATILGVRGETAPVEAGDEDSPAPVSKDSGSNPRAELDNAPHIKNDAERDALKSGTLYWAPDGSIRRKP